MPRVAPGHTRVVPLTDLLGKPADVRLLVPKECEREVEVVVVALQTAPIRSGNNPRPPVYWVGEGDRFRAVESPGVLGDLSPFSTRLSDLLWVLLGTLRPWAQGSYLSSFVSL